MSKKAEFSDPDYGRRSHQNADDRLPVRNMADWGCTNGKIKEPRYSDRAYDLCCPVGTEATAKIKGQVRNVRTPTMLAKQRLHKDPFQSQNVIRSTPGELRAPLEGPQDEKPRPFVVARKKNR